MEQSNELIKQIREAYAKEVGWPSFANMASNVNIVPRDISEIAKRYTEAMNRELQAKVDRYENCIQNILDYISECKGSNISAEGRLAAIENTLSKALSAGEDRICPNCNKAFNADRNSCCRECGSDEYNQKEATP